MSTHHDLVVPSGTTLGTAVRWFQPGARIEAWQLQAGSWVYYCGTPWPVYETLDMERDHVRIKLGHGYWWEPDLRLARDLETAEAVPAAWATVQATVRDQYGLTGELPHELSADKLTLTLLPHNEATRTWTAERGDLIALDEAELPAPPEGRVLQRPRFTYSYTVLGTFTDVPGARLVVQGQLVVTPTYQLEAPSP